MEKEILVYLDFLDTPHLAGRLWARTRKDRDSATFEYEKKWLAHPDRWKICVFSLLPVLHWAVPVPSRRGVRWLPSLD